MFFVNLHVHCLFVVVAVYWSSCRANPHCVSPVASIPKGLQNIAQGCCEERAATLGYQVESAFNLEKVAERATEPLFRNPFRVAGVIGSRLPRVARRGRATLGFVARRLRRRVVPLQPN